MIQQVERSYGSCVFTCRSTCRVREGALSLSGANLIIQPIKNENTSSWVDRKAGHTGGFRYPCSDPHVRPCSHTYTHGVPLYLPVLTLQKSFIKTHLIHSWVSSLFSSSMLCCWEVRCRGRLVWGSMLPGGCRGQWEGRVLMWCYVRRGYRLRKTMFCFGFFYIRFEFFQVIK